MSTCFTCGAEIDTHAAYCPACIAAQLAEQGDELAVFDAFHRFADEVHAYHHAGCTCGNCL